MSHFCQVFYNLEVMFVFKLGRLYIIRILRIFIIPYVFSISILPLYSQTDTEFWFAAPDVAESHGDEPILLRFSTFNTPAEVTVSIPANQFFKSITINIPSNDTRSVDLTRWIHLVENTSAGSVANKGLLVKSSAPITAYYEIANNVNPEIFSLKGKNALGKDFYIPSQFHFYNHNGAESIEIVAIEDNTEITVHVTDDVFGHAKNSTSTIMLNKGQTYSLRATKTGENISLAGTHIQSNKPIAVTISDDSIYLGGWDLVGDQLVPVTQLGTTYIVIKGDANQNDERIYIMAVEDNTEIDYNGDGIIETTLDAGETYWNILYSGAQYIETSKPVYVYHLTGHPAEAAAAILPPIICTGSKQVGFIRTTEGTFTIMLLTQEGNENSFILNAEPLDGSIFQPVPDLPPGKDNWLYARYTFSTTKISPGTANIIENTAGVFHLGILNQVGPSSEYGFYSGYSSLNIGADTKICPGTTYTLDAGEAQDTYMWNTGSNEQTIQIKDTGYYWVEVVKDECRLSDTIHIGYYPENIIDIGRDTVICYGEEYMLDATKSKNQYFWQDGSTEPTYTVTTPGFYYVFAIDINSCVGTDAAFVDYYPEIIFEPVEISHVSCAGYNDGQLSSTASGGTGEIRYSLDGIHFQDSAVFTDLAPGGYVIEAMDENNCSAFTDSVFILGPDSIHIESVTVTRVLCHDSADGGIIVHAEGGTGNLEYILNDTLAQNNPEYIDLLPGDYDLKVKDSKGCMMDYHETIQISNPPELTIDSIDFEDITCHNINDGRAEIFASGGTGNLQFILNDSIVQDTSVFDNLQGGIYSIVTSDANNCISSSSIFSIQNPSKVRILSIDTIRNRNCWYDSTAVLKINAIGGTGRLQYSIDNGENFTPDSIFNKLPGGKYHVVVKDSNDCEDDAGIIILEPLPLSIDSVSFSDPLCYRAADGRIEVFSDGGTGQRDHILNDSAIEPSGIFRHLTAGEYSLSLRDEKGCVLNHDKIIQLTDPPEILIDSFQTSDMSCFDRQDGTIFIEASGGTGQLSYMLMDTLTQNQGHFENLTYGNWQMTVIDDNACTVEKHAVISRPMPIGIDSLHTKDITCHGDTNGLIHLFPSGGTGELRIKINDTLFSLRDSFPHLHTGEYTFTIQDENECVFIYGPVNIEGPDPVRFTGETVEDITCHDMNDGYIKVSTMGGRLEKEYLLSDTLVSKEPVFEGLPGGIYTVSTKDSYGCIATSTMDYIVHNPQELHFDTLYYQNISCHNFDNGEIIYSVEGGRGSIDIFLNDRRIHNTDTINSLREGDYTLAAVDSMKCRAESEEIHIINPPLVKMDSIEVTHNICPADSAGKIQVLASGGTDSLFFSLYPGELVRTSSYFEHLTSGQYTVQVKDVNECKSNQKTVQILPPAFSLDTMISQDVSCYGGGDGSVSVSVSGSYPPYIYYLDDTIVSDDGMFRELDAGNHAITVIDSNHCYFNTDSFQIHQPDSLRIVPLDIQHIACFGENTGKIIIDPVGGTSPCSFHWFDDTTAVSGERTGLTGNTTYTVEVTDSLGCLAHDEFYLTEPPPLKTELHVLSGITCYGQPDGKVVARSQGGTKPYKYSWSGFPEETDSIVESLPANQNVSVIVTDDNFCTAVDSISLEQPSQLIVYSEILNQVSCTGYQNGRVKISAAGGTGPTTLLFDDQAGTTDTVITGLKADTVYVFGVIDSLGCKAEDSVRLSEPEKLTIKIDTLEHIMCFGDTTGKVETIASGGTKPYSYQWTDQNQTKEPVLEHMSAEQKYIINVTDKNKCLVSDSITLDQPEELRIESVDITPLQCNGYENGVIRVEATGGSPPYLYALNNESMQEIPVFEGLPAGEYVITVTDDHNCETQSAKEYQIKSPPELIIDSLHINEPHCYGDSTGQIHVFASGGRGDFMYLLNEEYLSRTGIFDTLAAGQFHILVEDSSDCSVTTEVDINQPEKISIDLETQASCFNKNTGSIKFSISGGTGELAIKWLYVDNQQIESLENLPPGTYLYELVDENGCIKTGEASIDSIDCSSFFAFPNIIKLSSNSGNHVFKFTRSQKLDHFQLTIFNQWGRIVHDPGKLNYTGTDQVLWNGRVMESERYASPGIYFYFIEITDIEGYSYQDQGFFHLFR